jgi:tetratricopeptide (TPR) repeat protein/DNA-binding winged helix-turn-helix (wHTH) protein
MKAKLGPLVIDELACTITCDQKKLSISRKAVELLIRLGHSMGRAQRRENLLRDLWPQRQVSDKALSMLVVELRRFLIPYLADVEPILTTAGVGYSLAIPYELQDSPAALARFSSESHGRLRVVVAQPVLLSTGAKTTELANCWQNTLLNSLGGESSLEVSAAANSSDSNPQSFFLIHSAVRIIKRQLLLSVRCVQLKNNRICWTATEHSTIADAFEAESRLALALCQELRRAATAYSGRQTWREYRQSNAFTALSEGQQLVMQRNSRDFAAAREKFTHALILDPNCAPALVGMADCEILGAFYGPNDSMNNTVQRALSYVERALALDPQLAVAYSTSGFIHLAQLRFADAEQDLLEGLKLDESSAVGLQWYADFLASQARVREAVQVAHLAVARAPDCAVVHGQLGQLLHMAGLFSEAQAQLQRALWLCPQEASSHCFLGLNFALLGNSAEALKHSRHAVELSPDSPFYRGAYGSVLAHTGQRERAQQQLHALENHAQRHPAYAEAALLVAAALGQVKRANEWLRAATTQAVTWTLYAANMPILGNIRESASFQSQLRHCGMGSHYSL